MPRVEIDITGIFTVRYMFYPEAGGSVYGKNTSF